MNRRTFIQRCFAAVGGVYAAFVPGKRKLPKGFKAVEDYKGVFKLDDKPFETLKNYTNDPPWHHSHFKGREFIARDRKIRWSVIYKDYEWSQLDFVELPSRDACEGLMNGEDKLYWLGSRELWEICYTGDYKQPFVFKYKGELERFGKRIGYRTIA